MIEISHTSPDDFVVNCIQFSSLLDSLQPKLNVVNMKICCELLSHEQPLERRNKIAVNEKGGGKVDFGRKLLLPDTN